jgi:serine/threonine-protein kinase
MANVQRAGPPGKPAQGSDPRIGRVVANRYRIEAPLGRGGMGQVYRAVQEPLGRSIALKLLPAHVQDEGLQRRFLLEAAVTARLTHPNTVTIFDHGRADDGTFFIAMELLEGVTLLHVLRQEMYLAQERAVHIAQQICRSLREAHALGIVHRDLKPANVFLLRQQDDHDFVKVLDFGLLKFFGGPNEGQDAAGLTNPGLFMGTPHYMAPEQARNQSLDQRTDVYSLGVLLYQMLTGKVPFVGPSSVDVLLQHVQHAPPRPTESRPDIDPALEALVLRCLCKKREERFETMDHLLNELKAIRKSMAGHEGPPSMPPTRGPNTSGEGLVLATPAQAMPALTAPLITPVGSTPVANARIAAAAARHALEPEVNAAAAPPAKSGRALVIALPIATALAGAALVFFLRSQQHTPPLAATSTAEAPRPAAAAAPVPQASPAPPQASPALAQEVPKPPAVLESRTVDIPVVRPAPAAPPPARTEVAEIASANPAEAPKPARGPKVVAKAKAEPLPRRVAEPKRVAPAVEAARQPAAPAEPEANSPPAEPVAPQLEQGTLLARAAPAAAAAGPSLVPSSVLQAELASRPPPRLSSRFFQMHRGERFVAGFFKVCVDAAGHVSSVRSIKALLGDDEIIAYIREGWRYKPQAQPRCAIVPVQIKLANP